jgi:predicted aspartyl protease
MKIGLAKGLPYIKASIEYRGRRLTLKNVLLDTGSASSVFSADKLLDIGLQYEPQDTIHRIRGVGGAEFVFTKTVDRLALGKLKAVDFEIEVGAMEYGFEIDGIVGMDFLAQVGALIDLARLEIRQPSPGP